MNKNFLFYKPDAYSSIATLYKDESSIVPKSRIGLKRDIKYNFIKNELFDEKKMEVSYKSKNYTLKKILDGEMSRNLKTILKNIGTYINQKSIVCEIGSGDGTLANSIKSKTYFTVDPSVESYIFTDKNNVIHINDFFNESCCKKIGKVDVVIIRHLLEHINDIEKFFMNLKKILKFNSIIYIEVPNFEEIINSRRFYDIFHDHVNYFTKSSLDNLLNSQGFQIEHTTTLMDDQHIGVFYKFTENYKNRVIKNETFEDLLKFPLVIKNFNNDINKYNNISLWGAGAHGVSIYNYLSKYNKEKINNIFDKDGYKENKYFPESKIQIKFPKKNLLKNSDCVIISSALYEDEIISEIEQFNFSGDILKTKNFQKYT